jgi:hypothetical protein
VNAAILLMGSAWMAGAETAQPPPAAMPAPGAPVAAYGGAAYGGGCAGCGAPAGCCDDGCGKKHGLLNRGNRGGGGGLFGKHHKGGDCGCAPAPAPCCAAPAPVYTAPVYTGFTTACCDPCGGGDKHGLFSKMNGRFGHHRNKGGCCDTGCATACASPCATPLPAGAAPPPPPGTTTPPKEMPKPVTPKTGTGAVITPPTTITPVGGPALSGTTSPY